MGPEEDVTDKPQIEAGVIKCGMKEAILKETHEQVGIKGAMQVPLTQR